VEMRVVVPDAASATSLAERLSLALGSERISVRGDGQEVEVQVERESDRSVLRILDTVERWYDQAGIGSVEMWLGERSYTLARWVPAQTWH
jgi:prophage tail gpP-like protein